MEQIWEPRNKTTCTWVSDFLTEEPKTYNGDKKASSINGVGKIGKPHAKE